MRDVLQEHTAPAVHVSRPWKMVVRAFGSAAADIAPDRWVAALARLRAKAELHFVGD